MKTSENFEHERAMKDTKYPKPKCRIPGCGNNNEAFNDMLCYPHRNLNRNNKPKSGCGRCFGRGCLNCAIANPSQPDKEEKEECCEKCEFWPDGATAPRCEFNRTCLCHSPSKEKCEGCNHGDRAESKCKEFLREGTCPHPSSAKNCRFYDENHTCEETTTPETPSQNIENSSRIIRKEKEGANFMQACDCPDVHCPLHGKPVESITTSTSACICPEGGWYSDCPMAGKHPVQEKCEHGFGKPCGCLKKMAHPDMIPQKIEKEKYHACGKDMGACEKCQKGTLPHDSEEEWVKEFKSKFFVYKLGGKFPDHVGAEKEAVEYISKLLKAEGEKSFQKFPEDSWGDRIAKHALSAYKKSLMELVDKYVAKENAWDEKSTDKFQQGALKARNKMRDEITKLIGGEKE